MAQSVFDIVKAPLGWSIFADNVKIGGIYGSKESVWARRRVRRHAAREVSFIDTLGAQETNIPVRNL